MRTEDSKCEQALDRLRAKYRERRDYLINLRNGKTGELLSGVRQTYYQRGIEALEAQLNARGIHNEPGV